MQKKYLTPTEVANELGVSISSAYKVIKKLNDELEAKGYFIVQGKVSKVFFEEKFYGFGEVSDGNL